MAQIILLHFKELSTEADYHALDNMLGATASTASNKDIENADLYIFLGGNPTTENPVLGWQMKRRMKNSAEAVVINSNEIDLVQYASAWGRPSTRYGKPFCLMLSWQN